MDFSSTSTYDLYWRPYKFFLSLTLFHSLIKYFLKNILLQVVLSCHVLDLLMPLIPILEKNMNNLLQPACLCHLSLNRFLLYLLTAISPSTSFFKKKTLLTFKELLSWHWVQLSTIPLLLQGSGYIIVATAQQCFDSGILNQVLCAT